MKSAAVLLTTTAAGQHDTDQHTPLPKLVAEPGMAEKHSSAATPELHHARALEPELSDRTHRAQFIRPVVLRGLKAAVTDRRQQSRLW